MSLREQLTEIYVANEELTPKLVVDVARDESHPLHSRFEWDDTVAGEKYRQTQASELIRSVRIRYAEADDRDVRAFLAVEKADATSRTYVPAADVARDDFTRTLVLKQAERDWRTLRARYEHLQEFFTLVRRDIGQTG